MYVVNNFIPTNNNLKLSLTNITNDICICLHIGNIFLAYDMYEYMIKLNANFDLIITINKELEISFLFEQFMEKIKMLTTKIKILNTENYGADIYPFLFTLKYFADNNIKYKYLLKLHTKTDNVWRHQMIDPLVNSPIDKIIESIESNGIYGYTYYKYDYLNHDYLLQMLDKLGFIIFDNKNTDQTITDQITNNKILQKRIPHDKNEYNLNQLFDFVPGTVFWTKFDLIMSEPAIFNLCEYSKVEFKKDFLFQQIPHAIERLFGIYRYNYLYTKLN